MDSFVDKLRMNNIYPSEGYNPFGPPDLSAGQMNPQLVNSMMQQMQGFQNNASDRQNLRQDNIYARTRADHLTDIASQMNQQNQPEPMKYVTVGSPNGMNDYQRGQLDLGRAELAQKTGIQSGQLAERSRTDSAKLKNTDEDQAIRQQRANVYDFKSKNPGMKVLMPKGGNIQFLDPITGKVHDSGISTGSMNERDKQELIGAQQETNINNQGQNQQNLQEMRGNQGLAEIAARTSGQQLLNENKPVNPELPTQTRVRQNLAARELVNSRPDLAKYIQIDSNGGFQVTPPGTNFFGLSTGPDKVKYDEIQKLLFPSTETNVKKPTEKKSTSKLAKPETKSKYKVTVE